MVICMSDLLSCLLCCCIETRRLICSVQLWEWHLWKGSEKQAGFIIFSDKDNHLKCAVPYIVFWESSPSWLSAKDLLYILYCVVPTWWELSFTGKEIVPLCSTHTQNLMKPRLWLAVDLQPCISRRYSPDQQCCSAHMSLDSPSHSGHQLGLQDASHGWSGLAQKRFWEEMHCLCPHQSQKCHALQEALAVLSWEKSHNSCWNCLYPQHHHHVFSKQGRRECQQILLPQSPRPP